MTIEDHLEEDDGKKSEDFTQAADPQAVDRFSALMFGSRNSQLKQGNDQEQTKTEEVNYFTLMEQIDDIMGSIDNLKPVFKHFTPIIDYIKKKI